MELEAFFNKVVKVVNVNQVSCQSYETKKKQSQKLFSKGAKVPLRGSGPKSWKLRWT